jgi:hypothetical protein
MLKTNFLKVAIRLFDLGRKILAIYIALIFLHAFSGVAHAQAPTVSYTVSGTPGDYTSDFTIQNNMSPTPTPAQNLYLFGVDLGTTDTIIASPAAFYDNGQGLWNNLSGGGSDENYNDTWTSPLYSGVDAGQSQSGFDALYTGSTAPTSVDWFAYTFSPYVPYTGGGNFYTDLNPGFEGTVSVPEPNTGSTFVLSCLGLTALEGLRRKRSQTATNWATATHL